MIFLPQDSIITYQYLSVKKGIIRSMMVSWSATSLVLVNQTTWVAQDIIDVVSSISLSKST